MEVREEQISLFTRRGERSRCEQCEEAEIANWLIPYSRRCLPVWWERKETDTEREKATLRQYFDDRFPLPDLGTLREFGSWASVAATIDRKILILTGYNPASTVFNAEKWDAYKAKLVSAPFWITKTSRTRNVQITENNLSKTLDAVEDLIKSVVSQDSYERIIEGVKKLATVATSSVDKLQKESFMEQGVISSKEGKLYVGQLRTVVEMRYTEQCGGYQQLEQKIDIEEFHCILDYDKCIRNARILYSWDFNDITNWEGEGNATNVFPNENPAWNQ